MKEKERILAGMDHAASEASERLDVIVETMTPEEIEGVRIIMLWADSWVMQAGYKRLFQLIKKIKGVA